MPNVAYWHPQIVHFVVAALEGLSEAFPTNQRIKQRLERLRQ
ncbi:MAG TPA: hypothetical protein VJL31_19505 [Gemmatimonadales bacterium]|jgi:hypothetical protein|nr:hypothetical protein [Gemmatimonadales bacterium]